MNPIWAVYDIVMVLVVASTTANIIPLISFSNMLLSQHTKLEERHNLALIICGLEAASVLNDRVSNVSQTLQVLASTFFELWALRYVTKITDTQYKLRLTAFAEALKDLESMDLLTQIILILYRDLMIFVLNSLKFQVDLSSFTTQNSLKKISW